MQIKIEKAPENLSDIDILAKILYAMFNQDHLPDAMVEGIFTIPYCEDKQYSKEEAEQLTYCYDKVEQHNDNHVVPSKYAWRDWGYRANELIKRLRKENMFISNY